MLIGRFTAGDDLLDGCPGDLLTVMANSAMTGWSAGRVLTTSKAAPAFSSWTPDPVMNTLRKLCVSGTDLLDGGSGDNWLEGSDGDDVLDGGDGNDLLTGDRVVHSSCF